MCVCKHTRILFVLFLFIRSVFYSGFAVVVVWLRVFLCNICMSKNTNDSYAESRWWLKKEMYICMCIIMSRHVRAAQKLKGDPISIIWLMHMRYVCEWAMAHTCAKFMLNICICSYQEYDSCICVIWIMQISICMCSYQEHSWYRVAKTHRIPYLYRSFSAKEPYIQWLFCGKWSAT